MKSDDIISIKMNDIDIEESNSNPLESNSQSESNNQMEMKKEQNDQPRIDTLSVGLSSNLTPISSIQTNLNPLKSQNENIKNQFIKLIHENELLKQELLLVKNNNNMSELDKTRLEMEHMRLLQQLKVDDDINKMYIELDNERRKKECMKQHILINIGDSIPLYPLKSYSKYCCNFMNYFNYNVIEEFDKIYEIITHLPSLSNYEKNLILLRFSNIQSYCSRKYNSISKLYNSSQIFLIACSIINPSLLSVNINTTNSYYTIIFWTVWGLQLLVSLLTGYISLFKWDKKNFLFNIYKTKINQEIWFFIGLTGKNYTNNSGNYNHSDYIGLFLNRLEKLYTMLKTTEFEMDNSKDTETNTHSNSTPNHIRGAEFLQSKLVRPR